MNSNKPSMTARKVALSIVTLGAKEGMEELLPPGIVESTTEMLVAAGVVGPRTIRVARSPKMVGIYEWFDWMLPGQFEAFAHRKAFCEKQAREGIAAGANQVLVLGAGYDTLAWRMAPEFPGLRFFEIDHPATARLKARGIEVMDRRNNLFLIAEDLGEHRLVDVLQTNDAWDGNARTVIIAEGLVMYLPSEAVRDLFTQCAAITGDGSLVVFSYIPSGEDGRPHVGRWTGLMLWLQSAIGEPWLWSIEPEELPSFLRETGWTLGRQQEKKGVEFFAVGRKERDEDSQACVSQG